MPRIEIRDGVLFRDGRSLACPFLPAVPVPTAIQGQLNFKRFPCADICPHWDLDVDGGVKPVLRLSCGDRRATFIITEMSDSRPVILPKEGGKPCQ